MNIIGFAASPRKTGNTAWTLDRILEGAEEQGAATQAWRFGDLDIGPCRACNGCKKGDSGCVVDDGMRTLYAAIARADAVVLGSPVYMGQMSAQAKIFTDRLYAVFSPRFSPHFKEGQARKKLLLAFTQGNPDEAKFQAYFDYTKTMFGMLEFDVQPVLVVPGLRGEAAQDRKELPGELRKIGASLVRG